MMKHTPWLVDGNKWCDNKVETRDVHSALKPLRGSQRRTQIVMSVSKVVWMTITQMPCDHTHNHAWRVETHHLSPCSTNTLVQVWDQNHSGTKRPLVETASFIQPLDSQPLKIIRVPVFGIPLHYHSRSSPPRVPHDSLIIFIPSLPIRLPVIQ